MDLVVGLGQFPAPLLLCAKAALKLRLDTPRPPRLLYRLPLSGVVCKLLPEIPRKSPIASVF